MTTPFVFSFLRNGAESKDMAVDGSSTPVVFKYTGTGNGLYAYRINWIIADAGIRIYDFFGGVAALTNGITIKAIAADDSTVLIDFTNGEPIKRNAEFSSLAGTDAPILDSVGTDILSVRWTLEKAGEPFKLGLGESIQVTIQDDLTGLTEMSAMIQGQRQ